ncbi:Endoplasmic reticulum oxidoreductin-1 [Lachnellula suecica]|uniref:Endoplasmic reticulum oxidoreductin-1 n=1 Tax=Lachnellula suecica TaxID=602035 RepID=A0A8T9C3L4_9HELO|nr:Endoplasmic reticulum oxidoreductin-1 [Lachnellula suecica]
MKGAARVFYLAVFALLGTSHAADSRAPSKSKTPSPDVCAISPKAIVSDACASYSTLDDLNRDLRPALHNITQKTDFFAYYRLNLFGKECPFWNDESSMCGNIACAVNTLDNEEDIPEIWRAEELGKLEGPKANHPTRKLQADRPKKPLQGMLGDDVGESCVVEYDDECDDRDYCVPDDEGAGSKGDYVSLVDNPERFTGYVGEGAHHVWNAIYRENCFSKASFPKSASLGKSPFPKKGAAANEFQSVMRDHERQTSNTPPSAGLEEEDECLEKRVFYRVISGMHTSISTHLCAEYLNQTTGKWGPNLQCYKDRLHKFPERVSNLYFNYALVLRAITKLGPYLKGYTFCSGDPAQDAITKASVQALTTKAGGAPPIFDETLMFVNGEGPSLKEDFRNRFRNVSRIMDCVGCDKCRLWGKLQTAGYGAALKVLFEFDNNSEDVPSLSRTELVALFNTLARISSSLESVYDFRTMVESEETEAESVGHHHHVLSDRATKPHHVVPGKDYTDSVEEDFEEYEREQAERARKQKAATQEQSVGEDIWKELRIFYKVFKYVMWGWVRFPVTMWEILVLEASRAWEYYIGLPVSPRKWEIKRPNIDEL